MTKTIREISAEIQQAMESRWNTQPGAVSKSSQPSYTPDSTSCSSSLKGKIKMWINMCIEYDLATNKVEIIKGPWTKVAGDSYAKKKQPKPPKVAEEAEIKDVEVH